MNQSQYDRVLESCKKHGKIVTNYFGVGPNSQGVWEPYHYGGGQTCPIGAFVIGSKLFLNGGMGIVQHAAAMLGATEAQVAAFIDGFDALVPFERGTWYNAGARMRAELGLP